MKKLGMKIFTVVNCVMGIVFIVSTCAVDSESWGPAIVCAISAAYLGCALYIDEVIKVRKLRSKGNGKARLFNR